MHDKYTFYTTTRLFRLILETNESLVKDSQFVPIMNYFHKYKNFDMNYQEEWEYSQLEQTLENLQIK